MTTCDDVVLPRKYSNHKSYELTNNYNKVVLVLMSTPATRWNAHFRNIQESHSYWSLHLIPNRIMGI